MIITEGLKNLAKTNFFKPSSINDIKKLTVVTTRQDLMVTDVTQVKHFSPAEFFNYESWEYEDFDYTISELGLRGSTLPNNVDLAAFGCSFTFGQALPINMLWHDILSKQLNLSAYNFGQPASNVKSIADTFALLIKHVKMKHAIFLLPPFHRLQIAAKSKHADEVELVPLIPNYKSRLETNFEVDGKLIYTAITDEEMLKTFKDSIYLIEELGVQAGIKTYFSSWCNDTYEFMTYMKFNDGVLLPGWTSLVELQDDFARDKLHPGPKHHQKWANEIVEYIK
jgi:hypothetical protein